VIVYNVVTPYVHVPTYDAYPWFYLLSPRKRLLRAAQDFQPDLILTITPYVPLGIGRSALYVAEKLRLPLVGSFDVNFRAVSEPYAERIFKFGWVIRLWYRYVSWVMAGYEPCAKIFTPSQFIWEQVEERYGAAKCVMFPRGVDINRFSPAHRDESFKNQYGLGGKILLLYVGRLSLEKNLSTMLDIYANLKADHDDLALMMLGAGPQREELERRGLPNVVFPGVLHGQELSRAYASGDIFLFTSRVDAGPMVVLEAMASGLPVVVFNQGGAWDAVIHGETGFVVKDVPDFTKCVDALIRDSQLRAAMRTKARKRAEEYQWEKVFGDLIAAFEEAVRANG
jgi:glycosyltransferase involved in cell wall biosynthesis